MIILFDGIGAKRSGVHTPEEYLDIMRTSFIEVDWNDPDYAGYLNFLRECLIEEGIQKRIPEEFPLFTLNDWLEFAGGIRVDN